MDDIIRRGNFRDEDPWRIFRIMSEFVDGFETLSHVKKGVAVFGSARLKPRSRYYKLAEETAYLFTKRGYSIITGAGPGIREAANKGATRAGGPSIGLNIVLPNQQRCNKYVKTPIEFRYFFCRKVMFAKYSKAFLVFPGGYGTLDELFEALALIQTERVDKFPVVLVSKDFWAGAIEWIEEKLLKEDMIEKRDLAIFHLVENGEEALKIVKNFYKPK